LNVGTTGGGEGGGDESFSSGDDDELFTTETPDEELVDGFTANNNLFLLDLDVDKAVAGSEPSSDARSRDNTKDSASPHDRRRERVIRYASCRLILS
jgi:hypothetical protein